MSQNESVDISTFIRNIFDNFPTLVCVLSQKDDAVLYHNHAAETILGPGLSHQKGKDLFQFDFNAMQKANGRQAKAVADVDLGGKYFEITCIDIIWLDNTPAHMITGIDKTEMQKSVEKLIASAMTDSMTGILNRKAGIDYLTSYAQALRTDAGNPFTVCFIDLNDLKKVNDNFGHAEGDDYIMTVVSVIKGTIRQSDIFARMGGDEFLLLFPRCAQRVVEDIMETVVNKFNIMNSEADRKWAFSIAYGICYVDKDSAWDVEGILNEIDARMYQMKQAYKNQKA